MWKWLTGSRRWVDKIKPDLQNKRYLQAALDLFNGFPDITYPFGGEEAYWKSVAAKGENNLFAPHNLWREVCHFIGGVLVGVPFCFFSHPIRLIAPIWFFGLMFAKEVFFDLKEQPNGLNAKNFADPLAWAIGMFAIIFVCHF